MSVLCAIVLSVLVCSSVHRFTPCSDVKTEKDALVCAEAFKFMYDQKNATENKIEAEYASAIPNLTAIERAKNDLIVQKRIIKSLVFGIESAPSSLQRVANEAQYINTFFLN